MTDLDTKTLRHALRSASEPASLDVALIMRRGRRLRNRRRLGVIASSLCAAAILAGSATAVTDLARTAPVQPVGPVQHGSVQPVGPAQHGSAQPAPGNPDSSAPPRRRASGGRPTPTPRASSLPPAPSQPPGATPSPVISSPVPTAVPTATP